MARLRNHWFAIIFLFASILVFSISRSSKHVQAGPAITPTPSSTPLPSVNLPIIIYQSPPTSTPTPTNTPSPTPTRAPLFVGLEARWDGRGFIRLDEYTEPGYHQTMEFTEMVDSVIIKAENYHWYDPNPEGWAIEEWDSFYSVRTGEFRSSSSPGDPAFRWGNYIILPYQYDFQDGETFEIGGQEFRVSGPHQGYGAFGQRITYWRMKNRETFLYVDSGDVRQYVHPGDITLEYDINTRLLLKRDVLRRIYYKGDLIPSYTIQYIGYLTSSNAYPIQQLRIEPVYSEFVTEYQAPFASFELPEILLQPLP